MRKKIYLQINISKDPKKKGIKEKDVEFFYKHIKTKKNIKLSGVMTILKNEGHKIDLFDQQHLLSLTVGTGLQMVEVDSGTNWLTVMVAAVPLGSVIT